MHTTRLAATGTREHSAAQGLGRVVLRESREAEAATTSDGSGDVQFSNAQIVAPRSRLLGAYGALDRILTELVRRPYAKPRERMGARVSIDRLVETIRLLTAL